MLISLYKNKIKYIDNCIYITFIVIPWIYIKLFILKIKQGDFGKKEIKNIVLNYVFMNLWMTGRIVPNNSIILLEGWKDWKKHSYYPRLKFIKFLSLSRKYYFNEMNKKYSIYFTY